jgi:hypothetical protein
MKGFGGVDSDEVAKAGEQNFSLRPVESETAWLIPIVASPHITYACGTTIRMLVILPFVYRRADSGNTQKRAEGGGV